MAATSASGIKPNEPINLVECPQEVGQTDSIFGYMCRIYGMSGQGHKTVPSSWQLFVDSRFYGRGPNKMLFWFLIKARQAQKLFFFSSFFWDRCIDLESGRSFTTPCH